ncbi:MAG: carbohydrate binding family 9 domain-containing protein [Gemmatimonadota bacterium]|nr:carbohydrate binding family 9 domain-containing protein [Gemmatimonadota bacterium]
MALRPGILRNGARPKIDGDLSDVVWSRAEPTTPFVQVQPSGGARPSQRTEVRVLIDHDALYIAMRMYDTAPDSIAAQLGRRDATGLYSDWARVLIDGNHDGRSAVEFAINPRGVKADAYWYGDTNDDLAWDAVWDGAARTDSLGWTAEFRIPLSQLRFSAHRGRSGAAAVWGIQFIRDIARYSERDAWSPIPSDATGFVSRFGILRDVGIADAHSSLEIAPYALASIIGAPGNPHNPLYERTEVRHSFGGDVKYTPRSDVAVNATVNPDFGQVEADPAVVNLTAYQVFFPEQRPFFVEGADLFQTQVATAQLFYSRRIGRAPELGLPAGAVYSKIPSATRILVAAKAEHRTGDGWSFGGLDAVTEREDARYTDTLGVMHTALVEPRVNYAVARATRSFRGGHSAVGVIATGVNRILDDSTSAALFGSAAYSGGIDVRHQFANHVYEAIASVVGTYVSGSPAAIGNLQRSTAHLFQRPDVIGVRYDSTRTSLSGLGAEAKLDKIAGHWRGGVDMSALSPGFEVNDVGFEDAADVQFGGAYLSYDEQRPGRRVRNWHAFVNQNWSRNIGGERLSHGGQLGVRFELTNNWSGSAFLNRDEYGLSVTESRGGSAIVTSPRTGLDVFLRGDDRRPLGWSVSANATNEEQTGGTIVSVSPALKARLSDRFSVSLAPTASRIINPWQYVTTVSATTPSTSPAESPIPRYVFGRVDQTSTSLTMRGTFIATPQLSLELYARPFVSTGNYSTFRELDRARSQSFNARLRPLSTTEIKTAGTTTQYRVADPDGQGFVFSNPDFDVVAFQSNAVLRWEYGPGSVLFLVWSQGRNQVDTDGALDITHATRRLWRLPPSNVLLLKMSYWLGR